MTLGISISRGSLPIEKTSRVLLDVHVINILSFVAHTYPGSPKGRLERFKALVI